LYGYADPVNLTDPSGMCPDVDENGRCDPGWEWRECFKPPSGLRRLTEDEKLVLTLFILKETSQRNYGRDRVPLLVAWPAQYTRMKIWALLNKASFDAYKINNRMETGHGVWSIYVSWHGEESQLITDILGPEAIQDGYGFDFTNFDNQLAPLASLARKYKAGGHNPEPEGSFRTSDYFSVVESHVKEIEPLWYMFGPNSMFDDAKGGIGYIDAPGLCKDGYNGYSDQDEEACENRVTVADLIDKNFMTGFRSWFTGANYALVSDIFEVGKNSDGQTVWNFTVFQKPPRP